MSEEERPPARWRHILLRIGKILVLSALLAAVLGFVFFQTIFPSVSVPLTERYPAWLAVLTFLAIGLLAGFLADSVESVSVLAVLPVFAGLFGAYLIFISPVAAEDVVGDVLTQFFFVIVRMALPLVFVAVIALFIAGFLGHSLFLYVERNEETDGLFSGWEGEES